MTDIYWIDNNYVVYGDSANCPKDAIIVDKPPSSVHSFNFDNNSWELPKNHYQNQRREEYPPVGDQLDAMLKYLEGRPDLTPDLQSTIDRWKKVKAQYPKDN